jgi:hypothetical protein
MCVVSTIVLQFRVNVQVPVDGLYCMSDFITARHSEWTVSILNFYWKSTVFIPYVFWECTKQLYKKECLDSIKGKRHVVFIENHQMRKLNKTKNVGQQKPTPFFLFWTGCSPELVFRVSFHDDDMSLILTLIRAAGLYMTSETLNRFNSTTP